MFRDSVYLLLLLWLSSLFCAINCQYFDIPPIACPDYFQYLTYGGTYIGKITLPNVQTSANVIDVHFSQRIPVQSNYYGRLSLYDDQMTTLNKLQRGEPISYRVDFPLTNVVPKLTQISVNGRVICSANAYPSPSTSLQLQHTLQTTIRPVGNRPQYTTNTVNNNNFNNFDDFVQDELFKYQSNPFLASSFPSRFPDDTSVIYHNPPVVPRPQTPTIQRIQPTQRPQTVFVPRTQKPQPPPPPPSPAPTQPQQTRPPVRQPTQQPAIQQSVDAVCGQEGLTDRSSSFSPFIYGGVQLHRGEYPWLTAIYRKQTAVTSFICGGSLISSSLVLSAAHCFDDLTNDRISVVLGRYNLSSSMEDVQSRDIQSLIVHPEYKPRDKRFPDADLALLRMSAIVSFTNLIKPICLWTESADDSLIVGISAVVAGWGLDENNEMTSVPKKVQTDIVSTAECLRSSRGFEGLTSERTFCAGKQDGTGPCMGDSGGGLMVYRNSRWVLRGVVSAEQIEQRRCNLREYVIYCDVAKHINWVQGYLT